MCNPKSIQIAPQGGRVVVFPSALVVFNFSGDDDGRLSQVVSANPGMPVLFVSTVFCREIFSQAEGRNRTFVFASKFVDRSAVDETYPASWLGEGNFIPEVPGNLSVTATDRGFRVDALPPDPPTSVCFG